VGKERSLKGLPHGDGRGEWGKKTFGPGQKETTRKNVLDVKPLLKTKGGSLKRTS